MVQSHLPRDPFAAHDVLLQRAEQVLEQRHEQRRKPLPEQSQVDVCFVRHRSSACIPAEVLDLNAGGMRLAAFVHHQVSVGDRCEISQSGSTPVETRWATVRWIEQHPLIQVFGVQFDLQ